MLLSRCLSVQETYENDVWSGTNHNINTLLFYVHMNTSTLKYDCHVKLMKNPNIQNICIICM